MTIPYNFDPEGRLFGEYEFDYSVSQEDIAEFLMPDFMAILRESYKDLSDFEKDCLSKGSELVIRKLLDLCNDKNWLADVFEDNDDFVDYVRLKYEDEARREWEEEMRS